MSAKEARAARLAQAALAERQRAHVDYRAAQQAYQAALDRAARLEALALAEGAEALL